MKKNFLALSLLGLLCAAPAFSNPIFYEGTLDFGPVFGSVNGANANCGLCGYGSIDALDFWSFTGIAGQQIIITGTRLDANLDLAFAVYQGITAVDDSVRIGLPIFADPGPLGLPILAVGDDDIPYPGGPYGDPRVALILPATGQYTVAVSGGIGILGDPASAYILALEPGELLVEEAPEPSTILLLVTGLAAAAGIRARKR
jgi:hypothetical protein